LAKRVYAKRYAQAVFELAKQKGDLDKWSSDLSQIAAVSRDADAVSLLESPSIHFEDKAAVIKKVLEDLNPLALNLVYLLMSRGRLSMAGEITGEFNALLDNLRGIEHGEAITAIPIDDAYKQQLEKQVSALIGKQIFLESHTNPALLGGIILKFGGKMLDGSTRTKLAVLRRELAGVKKYT